MGKRLLGAGLRIRAGLGLAVAGAVLCAVSPVAAQRGGRGGGGLHTPPPPLGRELPDKLLNKPSQPPAFTVPVQALGFSAPGPEYMGKHISQASLDFLDENRLLFTFRVPGLIRREAGESDASDERQIRAVVLTLPAGTVEAEALWTLHDRIRYLWMLKDGHFLLRDRNSLDLGDATLELKPHLRFPGPLLYLEMDPEQEFLVTDSTEPEAETAKPGERAGSIDHFESSAAPQKAVASFAVDGKEPASHPAGKGPSPGPQSAQPGMILRILRRDSGQVMLMSRTNTAVHLPINTDGYLERLRGRGDKWLLNLRYFNGGSAMVGQVGSTSSPDFDFISQREVLLTTFTESGGRKLVAMGTDGRRFWEYSTYRATAWPLAVMAPDGSRLAWEALAVNESISSASPTLGQEDVRGQLVEVLNAADGKVVLDAPASPALDAGGNVAISPSGRRVAVLNGGQIQVFELPPAPPLPPAAAQPPAR